MTRYDGYDGGMLTDDDYPITDWGRTSTPAMSTASTVIEPLIIRSKLSLPLSHHAVCAMPLAACTMPPATVLLLYTVFARRRTTPLAVPPSHHPPGPCSCWLLLLLPLAPLPSWAVVL